MDKESGMEQGTGIGKRTAARWKHVGQLALLAILLVVTVVATLPRRRLLLSRARRIGSASFLWAGKVRVNYPCFWLSDREAIAFQHPALQRFVTQAWTSNSQVYRMDAETGVYRSLPPFTKTFAACTPDFTAQICGSSGTSLQINVPCNISPDGKFAMITQTRGPACFGEPDYASSQTVVIAIGGSCAFIGRWEREEATTFWEGDSRHWREVRRVSKRVMKCTRYALDGTHQADNLTLPDTLADTDTLSDAVTAKGEILAEVPLPEDVIMGSSNSKGIKIGAEQCRCEWVLLSSGKAPSARSFTLQLPELTNILSHTTRFSPSCNRIAWLVTYRYEVKGPQFWRKLLARWGDRPHEETAIWVCDLDGSHAHEVGHLAHDQEEARPEQLAWLPGGQRLSFHYKGDLYTVPADG